MEDEARTEDVRVELPGAEAAPSVRIGRRVLVALALISFVALLAWLGGGYEDPEGGGVSLLDAYYYATVSITTTGYGDIRPVTDEARLVTTVLVTPARVLFLILLIGTTLEVLAEQTRRAYRIRRWRSHLKGHIVICGFGTKGRSAASVLLGKGVEPAQVVVIDPREEGRRQASAFGFAAVAGDASRTEVLRAAHAESAGSIIVSSERDDAAVLISLTARELNPSATIVAAVREEENAHLLRQSGADSVITSSGAAGRLLGLATQSPRLVEVLEDLLSVGEGLDILQRPVEESEVGPIAAVRSRDPVLAVIRDGQLLRFDDERAAVLERGDQLVCVSSQENGGA
jgi:voltage-gated potassium channel